MGVVWHWPLGGIRATVPILFFRTVTDCGSPAQWRGFSWSRIVMHYPRRVSRIKRVRKFGFRARMKTRLGRKMINRKRRLGRRLTAS